MVKVKLEWLFPVLIFQSCYFDLLRELNWLIVSLVVAACVQKLLYKIKLLNKVNCVILHHCFYSALLLKPAI